MLLEMHLCATTVKQLKWWHMILELVCDVLPCKVMFIIQMVCCLGAVTSLQMMECYEKSKSWTNLRKNWGLLSINVKS